MPDLPPPPASADRPHPGTGDDLVLEVDGPPDIHPGNEELWEEEIDHDDLDPDDVFEADDGVNDGPDEQEPEAGGDPDGEEDAGRVVELPRYPPLAPERLRQVMTEGDIELVGRMPYSSNGTFLTHVRLQDDQGDDATLAIFKPARGERPLWDFPPGLWQREVAAYEVAEALGWSLVPLTVTREAGVLGVGSLQRFVYARFQEHYFTLIDQPEHHPTLRRFCAFDIVANNTDRKAGHILVDDDDRLWGIDHGLCFGTESYLRTVIWEFGGDELSEAEQASLRHLAEHPPEVLDELLTVTEVGQICERARRLAEIGAIPFVPERHRGYPWPMV